MQSALHKVVGPREVHPENLVGRVAVVTGGAHGIGYEISRALAHAGCKVVMVNRKDDQGSSAIDSIHDATDANADVQWQECDLGNLAEVRTVFSALREELGRLDYLVLSAGVNANTYGLDADGIDRHFGVNYLGQWYATNHLWPLIRKTSRTGDGEPPRVVVLSSEMHRGAPGDAKFESLEEINNEKMDPAQLYGRSKLALILFAKFGLVERVVKPDGDNIYAVSVHPGIVSHVPRE
jgi:NAD(P)-dependent dehydrogenase (short-subunit alcohol dehydrogenase family)